jgi:hypothetical protein
MVIEDELNSEYLKACLQRERGGILKFLSILRRDFTNLVRIYLFGKYLYKVLLK